MKIEKVPCQIQTFSEDSYDGLVKAKVIIMHQGKNRNGSSFSLEAMKDAEETLKRRPLLAYIKRDEDGVANDFDSHNFITKIVSTDNGYEVQTYYLERPIGCFFDDCNVRYEDVDGVQHMVADCYIWEDYSNESLQLLDNNDGSKDVSMEIEVVDSQYNKSEKVLDINKFKFRGVTVLGSDVVQGMNGTCNLNLYTNNTAYAEFISKIENKIKEFKREGENVENEPEVIQQETVIEDQPVVEEPIQDNPQTFGLSVENLRDQAYNQISIQTITKTDWWGDEYEARLYWYRDLLPNDNVVVVESSNEYSYFGIPYSVEGDTITLDFDNKKEYISEWREKTGNDVVQVTFDLERDELKDIVLGKFNAKDEKINELNSEIEGLMEFKQSIDAAKYEADVEIVSNKFELGQEEIKTLKEQALNKEISLQQFEEKLGYLFALKIVNSSKKENFNSKDETDSSVVKIFSEETEVEVDPYGGLGKKYLNK